MDKSKMLLSIAALLLLAADGSVGETPETILIRSTLGNDLSGYRRADADLVLSAYHQDFVAYRGNDNADPRAWSVLYEDLATFNRALKENLATYRYEIERTLPFIYVRGAKAMVTSLDSGRVVDRQTATARTFRVRRFWTLNKVEDDWQINAMVDDLGDSVLAVQPAKLGDTEIVQLLQRERESWEEGDAGAVASLFDEDFIGYDGYGNIRPESWKIIFADLEELELWLEKRMKSTRYELDREVIFAAFGTSRREAVALTREKVRTTYAKGDVTHSTERYVLWTMSRRSGDWKITNMCYDLGLPD